LDKKTILVYTLLITNSEERMAEFLSTSVGQWTGIFISVLAGAVAQTMMKLGTERVGRFGDTPVAEYLFRLLTNPFVILAIMAYGFGVIFYMFMLSRLDLSYLYPVMTALGLVLATMASSFILQEQISMVRLGGIVVVIAGVFLLAQS
jgi:multidrug transporter EmrE-like cation transporter